MFLCHNLAAHFHLKDTEAAQVTAAMRSGVLWNNEELNKLAADYVQNNSSVKGKPNMTTFDFWKWVNKTLLPNSTLEPGFPRKVSVSTCQRWLHHLGFEVITPCRGIYYDGHEREDVVEYRKEYLRKMVKIRFIHFASASTESAKCWVFDHSSYHAAMGDDALEVAHMNVKLVGGKLRIMRDNL